MLVQARVSQDTSVDTVALFLEVQKQQMLVRGLQEANRDHEKSIQSLQATVDAAFFTRSYDSSYCGSDCTTIMATSSSVGEECPSGPPTEGKFDTTFVSPEDLIKEGTWYEE